MRRMILIAALMALICVSAQAAWGMYCSTEGDWYYHQAQNCQGVNRGYYADLEILEEQGKSPCPVCVQARNIPNELMAVERGGTIILRTPDEWLPQHEYTLFGFAADSKYKWDEAEKIFAEYLSGQAYCNLRQDIAQNGFGDARAYYLDFEPYDDITAMLVMNQRHLNGNWYAALRPRDGVSEGMNIKMTIYALGVLAKEDGIYLVNNGDWYGNKTLNFEKRSSRGAVYTAASGNLQISIFDEMDTNIAVIYEYGADAAMAKQASFLIEGGKEIELSGYMSGDHAVYCAVLTEGEVNAIRRGNSIKLWHSEAAQ